MATDPTLVIIPTYNEIASLPGIVEKIHQSVPSADILVVDDNSPDGTADWVRKAQHSDEHLQLLSRPGKQGLGPAYLAGFGWAIDHDYETVIEMDADGSHPAQSLPTLIAAISDGADLAIGSRWVHGGRVEGWPFHRYLLSRLGNFYIRLMLRLPVKDATAGFRAYRVELLERIDLADVESTGYSFQTEMTLLARRAGAKVREVPIVFREREVGKSKMSMSIMGESLLRVTRWGLMRRTGPLKSPEGQQGPKGADS